VTDAVTVPCARCGAEAATFSLLPPRHGDKSAQHGLQRTGFIGEVTKFGAADELQRLLEMIRTADYSAAQGVDADFVAFHCRQCRRSYCQNCWRIGPPEFDEGFYDFTKAVCPAGHEQIVDD
jgi:hypothetical protein